jgi:transcriptional regulator with GAF, ATPase, and Fis domain
MEQEQKHLSKTKRPGGYRRVDLGLVLLLDPDRAARQIVAVLRKHDGNNTHAARELGVSVATLKRWIAKLDASGIPLRGRIERMRRTAA